MLGKQPSRCRDAINLGHKLSLSLLQKPLIGLQVFQSFKDALLNGKFWCPAQCTDLGCIEKNERVVANPSTMTTRVNTLWLQPQVSADPTNRVIDLAILIGPKIIDIDLFLCLLNDKKDSIDTILHVEIRFALVSISQDVKFIRVLEQLFVKVKNMPV